MHDPGSPIICERLRAMRAARWAPTTCAIASACSIQEQDAMHNAGKISGRPHHREPRMSGCDGACPDRNLETLPSSESARPACRLQHSLRHSCLLPARTCTAAHLVCNLQTLHDAIPARRCTSMLSHSRLVVCRSCGEAHSGVMTKGYVRGLGDEACTGGSSVLLSAWCRIMVRTASMSSVRAC